MKKGLVFSIILLVFSIFCCTTIKVPQNKIFPKGLIKTPTDGLVPNRILLDQNWNKNARKEFWFTSQGSQIIPYTWFTHLEQPDNDSLFRNSNHIEKLGYLPAKESDANPSGLPIGFAMTRAESFENSYVGLTCAACHTNQLNYEGEKFLIDGAPTLGNFVLFYDRLVDALDKTIEDEEKFTRFANKVLPKSKTKEQIAELKKKLKKEAGKANDRRTVNALPADYPKDFTSYGRLDAFGNIANAGSAFALQNLANTLTRENTLTNKNPPTGPVSYPFLWGSHQSDVVQWNASAPNHPELVGPLVRNIGEVVGVFGGLEAKKAPWYLRLLGIKQQYTSTADFQGLGELEGYVATLRSPRWNCMPLPNFDRDKLVKGKAEFIVVDKLPAKYQVGIFKEPKTYKAWIRYSNLSGATGADVNKDSRGMAIKVMGVEGTKLLPELATATTQDFVLMSTQFFVAKDVKAFANLLKAINGGKLKTIFFFLTHIKLLKLFLKVRIQVSHLFDIPWGSTTPYLLGERAVKYAVLPQNRTKETIPSGEPDNNYLRQRMTKHLQQGDVYLDFYIQEQVDAYKMPIEDPRVTWDRQLSPFVKVANIRILQQTFDTDEQQLYGDNLSFSPWHSLPEHRPLGGINRGRKAIYDTMSKFRHGRNKEVSKEPTDWIEFSGK